MPEDIELQPEAGESSTLDRAVEQQLRTISEEVFRTKLDILEATEPPDDKAGIYIAPLPELEAVEVLGQIYRFYGARVLPGSHVNPHLHKQGNEPYYFVAGSGGEMNSGHIENGAVIWDAPKIVSVGEIEVVGEEQVHCFRNTGQEPFDFAFACPDEHLVDNNQIQPNGDRYFTAELPNGVPQWFSV